MTREELIQSPEYWQSLYEDECYRLGCKPDKVLFSSVEERDKVIEKVCEWLSRNLPNTTDEDIMYDNPTICDRDMIVKQFKQAMEEQK